MLSQSRILTALAAGLALWCAAVGANAGAKSGAWWNGGIIYEIYPRSFQDSNGDGIGDLNGVTSRLDYIKSLGVDAIWLAPVYPSPNVDFGYDISDYENIDPAFGTMQDFDRLVAEANKRHIRVIMDLVLNHTSDKHPWFIESESSRHNPKRDWYIWRDGKGPGKPPNNWRSWQYDAKTGQYYYHRYAVQQPDLNWRNPKVAKAMYDVERFWIKRGVSGFRLDAITALFEDAKLRDARVIKVAPGDSFAAFFGGHRLDDKYTDNLPEVHGVLKQLRRVADSFPGRQVALIGETWVKDISDLRKMYGPQNDELQLPMDLQVGFIDKMDAPRFRQLITEAETQLNGNEPLFVLDNHDRPRWDRYGDGVHNTDIGRVLSTVMLASRAVTMYYYGDEIGMVTTPPKRKEDARDPGALRGWPRFKGRDGERTPMQWTAAANAGFSPPGIKTWLPIPASSATNNVATEERDPNSILAWFKALGRLKHENAALWKGSQVMLNPSDPNVLAWLRKGPKGEAVVVICNFTAKPQKVSYDLKPMGIASRGIQTLLKTPGTIDPTSLAGIEVQPFGVYLLQVR
jgi:alpha-glucosidase